MSSPKDKELKMQQMLNAWQTLAAAKSFGGMTLAQFQAVAAQRTNSIAGGNATGSESINKSVTV